MNNSKYIVVKQDEYEVIIIFPSLVTHRSMANNFNDVISAGFVEIGTKEIAGYTDPYGSCYGKSITLNLKSREKEDTILLHKMFKFGDYKYY